MNINWGTHTINVFKSDMIQTQTIPSEIYKLDMDVFRLALKDFEDTEDGMMFTDTHSHQPPIEISGASLARVVEILDPYTVTFEDGQYRVNVVGANTNIGERINVNQVSVSTSNSAGLQDLGSLQAASFNGGVTVDVTSGFVGTTFPVGTRSNPVNNLDDALAIASKRGFNTINIVSSMTLTATDFSSGYEFLGDSPVTVTVTIDDSVNINNCTFKNMTVQGVLDNGNVLRECNILNISSYNGFIFQCALSGTISLSGGFQSTIMSCYSGFAGTATATIDMGGSGQALVLRDYSGGIKLTNKTGLDDVSIDMSSGQIKLDETVTNGYIACRGVAKLINTSTADVDYTGLITGTATIPAAGYIVFDSSSTATGTEYPVGTEFSPVNNWVDVQALVARHGVMEVRVSGNNTTSGTDSLDNLDIYGSSTVLTVTAGTTTNSTRFTQMKVQGAMNGAITFHEGQLLNVTGLKGHCHGVLLTDATFELADGSMYFIDCWSGVAGTATPMIDFANNASTVVMRGYSGGIELLNKSGLEPLSIDMASGKVKLAPTVTNGDIVCRGAGAIEDNSNGAVVHTDGLLSKEGIKTEVNALDPGTFIALK